MIRRYTNLRLCYFTYCFCGQPVRGLVNSMRGNPSARSTGNGARQCAGKSRCHPPSTVPLPDGGSGPPSNNGPTHVYSPRGISICPAVFAGLMFVTDRPADCATLGPNYNHNNNDDHFMAIMHVNLLVSTPSLNCRISLEQSFTTCTSTNHFNSSVLLTLPGCV